MLVELKFNFITSVAENAPFTSENLNTSIRQVYDPFGDSPNDEENMLVHEGIYRFFFCSFAAHPMK